MIIWGNEGNRLRRFARAGVALLASGAVLLPGAASASAAPTGGIMYYHNGFESPDQRNAWTLTREGDGVATDVGYQPWARTGQCLGYLYAHYGTVRYGIWVGIPANSIACSARIHIAHGLCAQGATLFSAIDQRGEYRATTSSVPLPPTGYAPVTLTDIPLRPGDTALRFVVTLAGVGDPGQGTKYVDDLEVQCSY
ncbi:hypothetical protein ACFQ05_21260 [Amycolatopsis umgeniensis]|uniref:Uncharacterized protein n=1 Tax=Amycolatopsis umgeniensis TaxID=336628 RepID=A0A841BGL8_9PSEU|nr:hypothetical protein [Amycolatopsis umgeniensis]MBB5858150.1 hypothetical protein [Amycolatopsis umgeniensis]